MLTRLSPTLWGHSILLGSFFCASNALVIKGKGSYNGNGSIRMKLYIYFLQLNGHAYVLHSNEVIT